MRFFCFALLVSWLAGCAGTHPKGISRFDDYDAVKVDQMTGNNISGKVFSKTIVCLNARRETRRMSVLTNLSIVSVTNRTVQAVTNQTITVATNQLITAMTNLTPVVPLPIVASGDAATAETNATAAVTPTGPQLSTNVSISLAGNFSTTVAPNQTAANAQTVRTYNNQLTTTANNLSVTLLTNRIVTAETNYVISYATNITVTTETNSVLSPSSALINEYFLYAELIPPSDFTLQTGESLVLLVDGSRYGLAQGGSGAGFVGRKGFTTAIYRVPPELLVAIANAKEAKVRFKGGPGVFEKSMSEKSKQNFRDFLLKYFQPGTEPSEGISRQESASVAAR